MSHLINSSAADALILWSAVRAILIAGITEVALRAFRVRETSLRLFAWKSVLALALAMPLLGLLLPPVLVPLPAFLQNASLVRHGERSDNVLAIQNVSARHTTVFQQDQASSTGSSASAPVSLAQPAAAPNLELQISWPLVATLVYLSGVALLLCRLIIGYSLSRKLVRASQIITDSRLHKIAFANAHGLKAIPRMAESELITVPVTVGALKPAILLPLQWREWNDSRLESVIAHELSHVARHDSLIQYVSLLHRAIFWFSPLPWWLDRRLAALAEQASDEAALTSGADRNDYAKTLLVFFEAVQMAPGRVWWQGVSMANGEQAQQRVDKILAWKGTGNMRVKKSLITAIVVLAIPVIYLSASVRTANADTSSSSLYLSQATAPPAPSSASVVPSAPAVAPIAGIPGPGPRGGVPAPAIIGAPGAAPITALVAPVAPMPPAFGEKHGFFYSYGYDDDDRFVIVSGKADSYTMSGSTQDIHHVERLKKQITGDFIWFQRDEKSYIIRDQATIDRAKAFWAPQEELGKKQEELGKQQEALGKQQEALGEKMEQVRVNVPADLTAKLDALKAKLQKLGPSASMEEIGDLQSEIGDLQGQIGEIQGRAGEQQGKLGEEQGKLGEQQGKLGEQQGKLGEEQGRLAEEAVKKTKALFDECIKNGKAQPEQDGSGGASL
jgi:beta-lactamase regulating signal transducer with metallopeptidase domain